MPAHTDPSTLIMRDLVDSSGTNVGPVGNVYLDDETHNAEWVSIQTGLFGTKESFVPLQGAEIQDDGLKVPYEKAKIKDAPRLDGDEHLEPAQEVELYRYYDIPYPEGGDSVEGQDSGSFLARTEHYGSGRGRLSRYAATDHEVAEAHRARLERGSGL